MISLLPSIHLLLVLNLSTSWYLDKWLKVERNPMILSQIVISIILAPFIEEVLFRYHLFLFLSQYLDLLYVKIIVAIFFGLVHLTNSYYTYDVPMIIYIKQSLFNIVLGYILSDYVDRIMIAILLHAYYNSICLIYVYFMPLKQEEFQSRKYVRARRASYPLLRPPYPLKAIPIRNRKSLELFNEMSKSIFKD
jgi:membrane protease YdiL (CAAX protease family)